jgi:hypothetical protein
MEQRYRTQIINLRASFLAQNGVTDAKLGTWDRKPHFHFMALYKQYVHKGKREDFVERVVAEMPDQSREEIEVWSKFFQRCYCFF